MPGFAYTYYKYANFQQLNRFPEVANFEAEKLDGEINIGGPLNTKEFSNIDPKKVLFESTKEKIREETKKTIEKGIDIVAPSCDFLPYTPSENIKTMVETVKQFGKVNQ